MTVATRHHQREAGIPPSITVKIRGSVTPIILDTGAYCSVTKKELQYMVPVTKTLRKGNESFIYLPTGNQISTTEQYDVRFNVGGKYLQFSLLAAQAESGLTNTVIFGCDAISVLNTALGSLKLQFQTREQSWKIQFVETESISETRAVASCYHLSTAKANDTVMQSIQNGWSALYIAAYINSTSYIGRVDTGSFVSLCKLTTAFKCNLDRQETNEAMPQLRFLGNNCIEPVGRAYATISIGPFRHRVLIYIVRDDVIPYEHADFVLGDDLLNAIAREYTIFLNLPKYEFKVSGLNVAVDETGHATLYQHAEDKRKTHQREMEAEELRQLRSENKTQKQKLADARKQRDADADQAERHRLERRELRAKVEAAETQVKELKEREEQRHSKEISASEQLISENRSLRRQKDEYWTEIVQLRNHHKELLQHCPSASESINVTQKLREEHAQDVQKHRAETLYWRNKHECRPDVMKKLEEANQKLQQANCELGRQIKSQMEEVRQKEATILHRNGQIVDIRGKLVEAKNALQDAIQADLDSYYSDEETATPKQKIARSSKALLDRIEILLDGTANIRKPPPKSAGSPAKKPRPSTQDNDDDDHRVCSVAPSKQMNIRLNIDGQETPALWDTGCDVTYMDVSLVPEDKYHLIETPRIKTAKAANGTSIGFHGSIKLPVILTHSKVYHHFHLADGQNCPSPCVVGKDLMTKLTKTEYIGWNIKENRIELGNDENLHFINAISFTNRLLDEAAERRAQEPLIAHALEDIIIPPRTDMIFTAGLAGSIDPRTDYIVEEKPHAFTMKVGRILVKPRERKIPMRVLNMANCPVRIPKGATIAYASPMGDGKAVPAETNAEDNYDPTDRMLTELFEAPTDDWETQIQKLDLSRSVFNHRQKRRLLQSLRKRKRAFVQPDGRLGRYRGNVKHRIRLIPGTKPVARRANRVPLALQGETRKQLEKLIKDDLIRPSTSPFAAPILHVPKKDGTFRMVCDFRALNQQMEPQTYSMPNIQSILDQCAGKKIFSSVDFSQAYHQTEIDEPDIHKSAFITEYGLFEWLITPYGITNSGDTFSRMMRELASQMSFRLMCFVDDVVLASDNADEHLDHLDEFLSVVEDHNLTLKLSKCSFGEAELHFLGMIISEYGMRPNPTKTAAIVNTPIPTTITAMKSFLGAVNYQRRYIPNCATILRPLYEICTGERLGEWGPLQQESFDTVKKLLTTAPVLASTRIGVGYILETDASKKGLGFVLLQPDKDGNTRVVAYGSRKTTKYEEKKDPCVLEAAAVRWCLEQCAPYLIGNPTTVVRTDNTAVKALLTKEDRNLTSQMNKYRLAIQGYNIRLEHRSGKTNKMADYLSRYVPEDPDTTAPPTSESAPPAATDQVNAISSDALRLTTSRIRAEQRREGKLRQFYETLSGTKPSSKNTFTVNEKTKLSKCSLRDGVICYQTATDAAPRIWLPERLREQAIRELHEDPLAGGHLGTNKVELKVRHRFYWPKMHDDISAVVSSCPGCQFRKAPPKITPTEPLSTWPTPRWPFDRIHLDLYGVLPLTKKRHRYVLTVADALTKWICAIPLKGQTAQEVHDAFLSNVIAKYGICSCAITDQGTQFLCKPFDQLASLYGFKHVPISAHHQASNGQIERFHKTLADMLSTYVADDPSSWDDYLASITMAYNCSVHAITGQSPFWSLYGREPNLPIDLRITLFQEEQTGQDGGIGANTGQDGAEGEGSEHEATVAQTERLRQLRRAWKDMKKTIEEKGAIRDAYRDDRVRAKAHQLTEGQLVLKRKPVDEIHSKFDFKFDGPYRLQSIQPPNATIRKLHQNAKPLTLHVDQIKPFKAAITLPIYSDCRDAPSDAEGDRLDARTQGEHAEALSEEESEAAAEHDVNAVRVLPTSPHEISIVANGYWKDVKNHNRRVLVFNANALEGRARIRALGLDGTVIRTESGATFPKSRGDWKFCNEKVPEKLRRMQYCDFKVCVFTNQLGTSNGAIDLEALKSRIEDIYKAVAVPMQFFIAVSNGFYRKPNIGMWKLLEESENDYEEVSKEHSFYVGDAAGRPASANRPADHSDSDEVFAANAGISFFTPDAFFRENSYTQYSRQRKAHLDHVDCKYQSCRPVCAVQAPGAHEGNTASHVSKDARGGHSDQISAPLTGDDWSKLMTLLRRVEENSVRNGDALIDGSGSDSDSGIDSRLIRTLGGPAFRGRHLRREENLPRQVQVELKQEILSRLRELEGNGHIQPAQGVLAEIDDRARDPQRPS